MGPRPICPRFYAMLCRDGRPRWLPGAAFDYYQAIWARFLADGLGHVLLADVEGVPVAGLFLFRYGPTAWYFYGASTATEPRSDAQPRASVGGDALGEGCRLHALRLVGCAGRARRERPHVGRLPVQAGVRRRVHTMDRRVGLSDQPVGYWAYTVAMPKCWIGCGDVGSRMRRTTTPCLRPYVMSDLYGLGSLDSHPLSSSLYLFVRTKIRIAGSHHP